MTRTAETSVEPVGSDDDYQRVYVPARLCRDSQYPLTAGETVTAAVVGSVVVIGARRAVKRHVTNSEDGGDGE